MSIESPEIAAYAAAATTPMPDFMDRLEAETRASLDTPEMLTGPVEARFLQMLVFAIGARRVLEIGTYSGYSALAMAAGLPEGGRIVTCELSGERADFAQRHVDASPYADRIEIRRGPALETIATLAGPFELVFIDADKPGYPDYFHATLPLLSERGLIVLDNTLRDGTVLDPRDATSRIMADVNAGLANDPRGVAVLLPFRDGVTLFRRA